MANKKLKLTVDAAHWSGNSEGWTLRVHDPASRSTVCEISVSPVAFYQIMSNRGAVPVEGRVFDTYDRLGLQREHKSVELLDPRLFRADWKDRQLVFDAVIEDHRAQHETDGWMMCRVLASSLSQGQYDSSAGKLRVTMERYVPAHWDELADQVLTEEDNR